MSHEPKSPLYRPRWAPHAVESVVIHAVLLGLLITFASRQTAMMVEQKRVAWEKIERQQQEAAAAARREEQQLARDQLLDELMEDAEDIVEEELAAEDEAELLEELQEHFEKKMEEKAGDQEVAELPKELLDEIRDNLRQDLLNDIREQLQDVKRKALLDEVADFVREKVAPEVEKRIEEKLEKQAGEEIKKKMTEEARDLKDLETAPIREKLERSADELKQLAKEQQDAGQSGDQQKQKEVAKQTEEAALKAQETLAEAAQKKPDQTLRANQVSDFTKQIKAVDAASKALETGDQKDAERKANAAAKALAQKAKEMNDLAKAMQNKAARQKPLDASQKTAAQNAMDDIRTEVETAVSKEINKEVVPKIAKAVANKFGAHAKKEGFDSKDLQETVEREAANALTEALNGKFQPNADAAMQKAKDEFGGKDTEAMAAAKSGLEKASKDMKNLAAKQSDMQAKASQAGDDAAAAQKAAPAQNDIAKQTASAQQTAAANLKAASAVSTSAEKSIAGAKKALSKQKPAQKAKAAESSLKLGHNSEAAKKMSSAAKAMKATAAHLEHAAKAIGKEIEAAERTAAATSSAKGSTSQTAAQAKSISSNTAATASIASAKAVEQAAGKTQIKGILTRAGLARLSKINDLKAKLDQLEKNMQAGVGSAAATSGTSTTAASSSSSATGPAANGSAAAPASTGTGGQGQQAAAGAATGNAPGSGGFSQGTGTQGGGGSSATITSDSHGARYGLGYNHYAGYNREVYKHYKQLMSERLAEKEMTEGEGEENGGGETAVGKTSRATREETDKPQIVFVPKRLTAKATTSKPKDETDKERVIPKPRFKSLAFGAAAYQTKPLTIDGDASDWGELKHPIAMRWGYKDNRLKDPLTLHVRWSSQGFFFLYRVPGRTKIEPCLEKPYEGDCFEVFLDVENLRKASMGSSPFSQQFCLMPFGCKGSKVLSFAEVGRGFRGIRRHAYLFDGRDQITETNGMSRGKVDADGYTVEGFISIKALAKKKLKAGMYVAMNFSINRGMDYGKSQQWSLSKAQVTYEKPDTWGDVLLLGSDGIARFVDDEPAAADNAGKGVNEITPGDPMVVEVTDHDMNVNPGRRDKVLAEVRVKGSTSRMFIILEETGLNSGKFRGSFDTQMAVLPVKENTLNVRGGDLIELYYRDPRAAYGEKDRKVESRLQIGLPIYKLSMVR